MQSTPAAATTPSVEQLDHFFTLYREAFERMDATEVASFYSYPVHVTSDLGGSVVLSVAQTQGQWVALLEQLLTMYKAVGFDAAELNSMAVHEVSSRVWQAHIDWAIKDDRGGLLYVFQSAYTLFSADGLLRVGAVAHNEIPQYRQCAARLKALRDID